MSSEDNISEVNDDSLDQIIREERDIARESEKVLPFNEMFTIGEACKRIAFHYEKAFKSLRFFAPIQLVDGAVAEFIDEDTKVTIATCRVRLRNLLTIDKNTGVMQIEVQLSDMVYARASVNLSVVVPS